MAQTDVSLTPDQRVRVLISSTLEEPAAERAAARRAIRRLHPEAVRLFAERKHLAGRK
jgi:hypothetical protein